MHDSRLCSPGLHYHLLTCKVDNISRHLVNASRDEVQPRSQGINSQGIQFSSVQFSSFYFTDFMNTKEDTLSNQIKDKMSNQIKAALSSAEVIMIIKCQVLVSSLLLNILKAKKRISDVLMVSLRCTHGIPPMYWNPPMYWTSPMYSWYPPHSSWFPPMYWTSPDVLMISPRCTHDIPPMYSWYPPDVLMIPSNVRTPPDVLNIPRCTEHTLYRVVNGILQGVDANNQSNLCNYC